MSHPSSDPELKPAHDTMIANDMGVLARRYALALYELAEEKQSLDAVATDLSFLKSLLQQSTEFQLIARHPRLARADALKAVQQITESAKLTPLTKNFLSLAAQNRRLSLLGAVVDSFLSELTKSRGEYLADVRAAQPLSPAQQQKLAAELAAIAGGKVHMSIRQDASLLGGFIVRMGSRLIDASIKNKLVRLERQLKSQDKSWHKGAA